MRMSKFEIDVGNTLQYTQDLQGFENRSYFDNLLISQYSHQYQHSTRTYWMNLKRKWQRHRSSPTHKQQTIIFGHKRGNVTDHSERSTDDL